MKKIMIERTKGACTLKTERNRGISIRTKLLVVGFILLTILIIVLG